MLSCGWLATTERVAAVVITKGLQQHAVEAEFAGIAELLDPDRHGPVAGLRLRPISAEQTIPPGKIEAEIAVGLGSRRGWFIFAGAVSILLGVLLWAQFPLSGAWALGILLGIKLLFIGLIMIMGGSAARSMASV